jgi:hypothetical protein
MKILHMLAVAGVAAGPMAVTMPVPANAQVVSVAVGPPAGPGWYRWRERKLATRGWIGPVWVNERGNHYGRYRWRNSYYQNCSWKWVRPRVREWHCW